MKLTDCWNIIWSLLRRDSVGEWLEYLGQIKSVMKTSLMKPTYEKNWLLLSEVDNQHSLNMSQEEIVRKLCCHREVVSELRQESLRSWYGETSCVRNGWLTMHVAGDCGQTWWQTAYSLE